MTRLEDITKKYPFMYEINGMVYCIGQGAFYTYTNQIGLEYFRKYPWHAIFDVDHLE